MIEENIGENLPYYKYGNNRMITLGILLTLPRIRNEFGR